LIRYDERGNGLSDWNTPELSFGAFVEDLECVVDCLGLEQFDLLAISQGAAVAVAYAVRRPERVRRLVICNGYAAGWAVRGDPQEIARREAMITLTEVGWGMENPAYRQLFTDHYIPEATPKQMGWFNEMQRLSASPENAVRLMRAFSAIDVSDLLPYVSTPTLIFHSRHDQAVPFARGEELAALIKDATFIPLQSKNHILLEREPAPPLSRLGFERVSTPCGSPDLRLQSEAIEQIHRSKEQDFAPARQRFPGEWVETRPGKKRVAP
jgi:pimeloyl-ACP methyl ester carboxylesterase